MLLALLLSLTTTFTANASATFHAPVNLAALSACDSRVLEVEINVDGATPKIEMVEAIKLLADYSSFTITPQHSEQSSLLFYAALNDNCVSDSCARINGWFDLQKRLSRIKGVVVSCSAPASAEAEHEKPTLPGGLPQRACPGRAMPFPSRGGVTGTN